MRKIVVSAALAVAVLAGSVATSKAAVVANLGVNPTSATGTFQHTVGGGPFDDQITFQLVGGPQFLTIASVTNVFPNPTDLILNFTGSVFQQVGAIGGADDIRVIGPVAATANCGISCQGFAGSGLLSPGLYYLDLAGTGLGTAGYGGNLSTTQVGPIPEPATWAMTLIGFAGVGFMAYRRKNKSLNFRLV
jgi:hypothetical protein